MDSREESWRRVASTHNLEVLLKNAEDSGLRVEHTWKTKAQGLALLVASLSAFALLSWIVVLQQLSPESSNGFMRSIPQDRYYYLLVPLTIPVTAVAVAFHWFCLKLFKHN